jgi:hypothetical protein
VPAERALFIRPVLRQHRRVRFALVALGILLSLACNTRSRPAAPAASSASAAPDGKQRFGKPLTPAIALPIAALLATPQPGQAITVEGSVRKACTRRGCWMELAESPREGTPGCRVTFKNYGFFVPTNSAGSHARVQGVVEVDTLPAASVRHYEEEGAIFASKQPDGTAMEVRLVATGVELWR